MWARAALAGVGMLAVALAGQAQTPVVHTDAVEATATIEVIDHDSRLVTLTGENGRTVTVYCGPEVQRFDELKVGDTLRFRYCQSIASAIRKPGKASDMPAGPSETISRGRGKRPSATVAQQRTITVEVVAVDPKAPSITVLTRDGRRVSFAVDDKKKLEGVVPGGTVEVV